MRESVVITLLSALLALPGLCFCADPPSPPAEGYTVVEESRVVGDYQGCTASAYLRFTNGKLFACSSFGYDNSQYMPVVSILKNKEGAVRIRINGKEYSGSFIDGP